MMMRFPILLLGRPNSQLINISFVGTSQLNETEIGG